MEEIKPSERIHQIQIADRSHTQISAIIKYLDETASKSPEPLEKNEIKPEDYKSNCDYCRINLISCYQWNGFFIEKNCYCAKCFPMMTTVYLAQKKLEQSKSPEPSKCKHECTCNYGPDGTVLSVQELELIIRHEYASIHLTPKSLAQAIHDAMLKGSSES